MTVIRLTDLSYTSGGYPIQEIPLLPSVGCEVQSMHRSDINTVLAAYKEGRDSSPPGTLCLLPEGLLGKCAEHTHREYDTYPKYSFTSRTHIASFRGSRFSTNPMTHHPVRNSHYVRRKARDLLPNSLFRERTGPFKFRPIFPRSTSHGRCCIVACNLECVYARVSAWRATINAVSTLSLFACLPGSRPLANTIQTAHLLFLLVCYDFQLVVSHPE